MALGATSVSGWVNRYAPKVIVMHLGSALLSLTRSETQPLYHQHETTHQPRCTLISFLFSLPVRFYLFPHVIAVLLVLN
jgi:hypothetical protein